MFSRRFWCIIGRLFALGDNTVRVWNLVEGRERWMLVAHQAAVRCVQFDGRRIVSGSYDTKIAVFDGETGRQLHLLTGHQSRVYSLLLDSSRSLVVSGSLDTVRRRSDKNGDGKRAFDFSDNQNLGHRRRRKRFYAPAMAAARL